MELHCDPFAEFLELVLLSSRSEDCFLLRVTSLMAGAGGRKWGKLKLESEVIL